MLQNWAVTYEIVTEESAEDDEVAERGFEWMDASFRDAMHTFGDYAVSADNWPISLANPPRWFDGPVIEDRAHIERGEDRHLSLHIPAQITPSSRLRLARYLGLKTR